ncbi:HNH endonuclease [Sinorhizobium meliloti]|uniref:HNH endonuclease n=1 Tax=Rhizobium meliloti TaxID=382 RepID=UPI0013E2997C|nr:HNH endonuclease [Sinorhizobium meliloti]
MRTSEFTIEDMTSKFLRECFRYEPDSGNLYWKDRPASHFSGSPHRADRFNSAHTGMLAGVVNKTDGYLRVNISRIRVGVHRVIWAIWHDIDLLDVPPILDHINGVRVDNRILNLRPATPIQNSRNRTHDSESATGVRGVTRSKSGCTGFIARIGVGAENVGLGSYKTIEEARAAYLGAARLLHGDYMRQPEGIVFDPTGGA